MPYKSCLVVIIKKSMKAITDFLKVYQWRLRNTINKALGMPIKIQKLGTKNTTHDDNL